VNGFTASYGDVDLCTFASNEGTSVPSLLMDGDGSSSSPYEISTASDLQAMQEDLSANYIVVNDINASCTVNWNNGQGFDPIGDYDGRFTGSLDGKTYDISGLNIKRQSGWYVGLFGAIGAGGEVKNVGVINVNITGNHRVGGLVGDNYNGNISNSYSTGNVTGEQEVGGLVGKNDNGNISNSYSTGNVTGDNKVGGLVGDNIGGTVSNSYSTGNVNGESYDVGGLVGDNANGNILNSYSTGNVTGESNNVGGLVGFKYNGNISNSYSTGNVSGNKKVGGLVGRNYKGTVSNSYSTVNVTGNNNRVGGLVGLNYKGNILNSYSTGNVAGGELYVGGLIGENDGGIVGATYPGNISNSYWDTEATGQSSSEGLTDSNGLTTSEMQGSSAEGNMNFDFTDTWSTVEGDYPELQE